MKKMCLLFIVLASSYTASTYANIILKNDIVYNQSNSSKSQVQKYYPDVKKIILTLNGQDHPLSFSPNNDQKEINLSFKDGDKYIIKIQAADKNWYHTKTLTFRSELGSYNQTFIINGVITPLNLVLNGKIVTPFYNENDWPGVGITCENAVGGFNCNFAGPNGTHGYLGPLVVGFGLGVFTGTGYFDPTKVYPNKNAEFLWVAVLFYAHASWNKDNIMVGYANFGGLGAGAGTQSGSFY